MRLLKIGVYNQSYLAQFHARHPALASQPYAVQHAALMTDGFGSSDFWTTALNKLGYLTLDVVANDAALQSRWAEENNIEGDENDQLFAVTIAQIKAFRPEVLIVADYATFNADALRRIKHECPSIRLILGWCGAPYSDASVFREWDIVLSCIPELVERFRADGHRAFHLNHAFEPRILERIDTQHAPSVGFAFLGSIVKRDQFHKEREHILTHLVEQTELQIWSHLDEPSKRERRAIRARQLAFDTVRAAARVGVPAGVLSTTPFVQRVTRWKARPDFAHYVDERLARRTRPPLFGLEMFQQLHDARVALNTHIDISPASASNMRLFEATGVGTCLLTDWKENLPELFEPDAEVVAYRDAEECVEKVKFLLSHEAERRAIAAAGQRRTLRDHTFTGRAEQIDGIISDALLKH
jgi:spore maturation protein CgeB